MKEYVAKKIERRMTVSDERWEKADTALLDCVWENSHPSPYRTFAKMVHGEDGYTVLLVTDEWPLVAKCTKVNGMICRDSCMEFFFTPNEVDREYMNFEINPVGMLHLGFGEGRGSRTLLDTNGEVEITSEVRAGKEWRLMLHIPYTFMKKHYKTFAKTIRANFYKCGDETPIEHYSTWSPVGTPAPDYHQPSYFGRIILSDEAL